MQHYHSFYMRDRRGGYVQIGLLKAPPGFILSGMILRPKLSLRYHGTLTGEVSVAASKAAVPAWLRRAVPDAQSLAGKNVEEVALIAGATISALDAVVRRQV